MDLLIDVKDMNEAQAAMQLVLNHVASELANANFQPVLKEEVVPLLSRVHEDYFNRESGPVGDWAPLAPATVKRKGFDTILVDFNNMRSSLLFTGTQDHIEDVSEAGLTWGTSDHKAHFHMDGTTHMPARPFVGLTEPNIDEIGDILGNAAVELLKG
jgi:phage gpG-like protein